MEDLKDYSGEFRPDLDLSDFSKDFLLKLFLEWFMAYEFNRGRITEDYLREKLGKSGGDAHMDIWIRAVRILAPRLAKLANIKPKTLVDGQKVGQLFMDGALTWRSGNIGKALFQFITPNHLIVTFAKCPGVVHLEAESAPAEAYNFCKDVEPDLHKVFFGVLLPGGVQVKPLKLPPRESKDDVACIWEIKY